MNYSILKKIPLFIGVLQDELERIFAELNVIERNFQKGEILAMQGEPVNRLIILLTGSVKGEMNDASGKLMKVEDILAPSPLAILFLFGKENRFPVQVTALEEVEALIVPKLSVLKMLSINSTILQNYLDISADFASKLSKKLHLMSFRTIRQKVAVYLLELSSIQGSENVRLDKTKTALAEYFGVSRPSLEREISRLENEDLILSEGRQITIVNRNKLMKLINF